MAAWAACLVAGPAAADAGGLPASGAYRDLFTAEQAVKPSPWRVSFQQEDPSFPALTLAPDLSFHDDQQARPRVVAVEYSDAYKMRARIHRIASFATLPLFATEVYLGQSVYNGSSGGRRSAHIAVGTAITGLFAVNSVTGIWNLWEGRKDPTNRTRRFAHGLLMLAAGAGFVATAAVAPNSEREERRFFDPARLIDERRRHRAVALTSIGIGTAGYLVMLLGGH
jgi:hypothetical protein